MAEIRSRSTRAYRRLVAELRAQRRQQCVICGEEIDYSLEYPDKRSFSAHHLLSWNTHPHLRGDPDNLAPTHLGCNLGRPEGGTGPFTVRTLGASSRDW